MSIKLGVLLSGSGTNLQAIIDRIAAGTLDATIELVVASRPDAYGIKRAQEAKLQTLTLSKEMYADPLVADEIIATELRMHEVDYVIMAGYMRMVHEPILATFPNRVVNLHSFKGAHAIQDAYDYGVKVTGVTVHFADDKYDCGPIIAQEAKLQTLTLSKEMYADPLVADEIIATELRMHEVDYVIMAGYMRMVHEPILATFPNRVVNLHAAGRVITSRMRKAPSQGPRCRLALQCGRSCRLSCCS